jgi:RNA polymerase primary sigma factor
VPAKRQAICVFSLSEKRLEVSMKYSALWAEGYSLEVYFREVRNVEPISQEGEIDIFMLYKETQALLRNKALNRKEEAAANILIQSIQSKLLKVQGKLVFAIARKYSGRGLDYADLIQEGNAGILKAVDKFDPGRGYRFSTYAQHCVHTAIRNALTTASRTVRVPAHIERYLIQLNKEKGYLAWKLGRTPTDIELMDALGWERKQLMAVQKAAQQTLSPDDFESDDAVEYNSSADFLNCYDPVSEVMAKLCIEELYAKLTALTLKERKVLALRFGLYNYKPGTLQEISSRLSVSREAVRQTESRAIGKLRKVLCA